MRSDKQNIVVDLSFQFALAIISFSEKLNDNGQKMIAYQLLKSGTSVGANIREAQNAESKFDFIHKLKIAAKEADETSYWLESIDQSESNADCKDLIAQITQIIKLLSKIISTSKKSIRTLSFSN